MTDPATRSRGARAWILLCRVTVTTAAASTAAAMVVSLSRDRWAYGALDALFLLTQRTLYRAMTYGL